VHACLCVHVCAHAYVCECAYCVWVWVCLCIWLWPPVCLLRVNRPKCDYFIYSITHSKKVIPSHNWDDYNWDDLNIIIIIVAFTQLRSNRCSKDVGIWKTGRKQIKCKHLGQNPQSHPCHHPQIQLDSRHKSNWTHTPKLPKPISSYV